MNTKSTIETFAVAHSFDGYGWQYIDNGSGSTWLERGLNKPDATALVSKEDHDKIVQDLNMQILSLLGELQEWEEVYTKGLEND